MNQPVKRLDLRLDMPETAKWVDVKRLEWGPPHVNACIRRALGGEPGFFYAIEAGKVLGAPFPATHPVFEQQRYAVMMGCSFAGFMLEPKDSNGAH